MELNCRPVARPARDPRNALQLEDLDKLWDLEEERSYQDTIPEHLGYQHLQASINRLRLACSRAQKCAVRRSTLESTAGPSCCH